MERQEANLTKITLLAMSENLDHGRGKGTRYNPTEAEGQ